VKVKLFYAHGTAWALNWLEVGLRVDQTSGKIYWNESQQPESQTSATIAGINGRTAQWDGAPQNDPFAMMVDPDKFDAVRIEYPASMFPMNASMDHGIAQIIDGINALPFGQPFVLGGYSQGAALMSTVFNELRYGTLTSRASMFLGGVMFGNPRRQVDHRGAVGGTWSGAWDVPGSTTGGHGSFPASGSNFARLSNCPSNWVEFTYPGDVFAASGDSTTGQNWTLACDVASDLDVAALITYVASGMTAPILAATEAAFTEGGVALPMTDATGADVYITGSGHTAYPFLPPYGVATTDTCYQVALKYLDGLADAWATAPVLQPNLSVGWSTTLLPPAV